MVADIADKATRAANMVMIYPTKNFRELFSKLYAQVFLFYRDAIHWYAKSKVSRAFDSFNANLTKPYEKAVEQIESHLTEIYREAEVAKSAQMAVFVEDLEARLRHQREQATEKEDLVFAGRQGQRLLLQMHESACIEAAVCCTNNSERIQSVEDELASASTDDILDRAEVKALSGRLVKNVIGSEGPSLFKDGRFWLPEVDVSLKLSDWISPDTPLSTLWISSPALSQGFSSSRAAAMVAAVAAWDSELPVISHFCERPRSGSISQGCTIEKAGLLGLVYSLTIQLLQFNVKDDAFHFPREQFEGLDGSEKSWPDALLVLQELLRATPHLQRCIIDGLNDLAFSSGAEWCGTFLAMLLEHQRTSASGFKILLTTTGQSRVLPEYIQAQNRAFVQGGAREVIRGGKWLNAGSR
ncbi:hypothetical protein EKO04_011292 [Ascochyta lentis]|uniref:DUF7708 domain-containing protein n=1 Tax=Ascochyta lentis TaxID=205686 RepID=A0A8H7IWD2_9PLEO|nr:hypothetical protein EKO04_011292 [Ascochyta lentis]